MKQTFDTVCLRARYAGGVPVLDDSPNRRETQITTDLCFVGALPLRGTSRKRSRHPSPLGRSFRSPLLAFLANSPVKLSDTSREEKDLRCLFRPPAAEEIRLPEVLDTGVRHPVGIAERTAPAYAVEKRVLLSGRRGRIDPLEPAVGQG